MSSLGGIYQKVPGTNKTRPIIVVYADTVEECIDIADSIRGAIEESGHTILSQTYQRIAFRTNYQYVFTLAGEGE